MQTLDIQDQDPTAVSRKSDHIELAFKSQIKSNELDHRFYYEPMLSGHPDMQHPWPNFAFLNKVFRAPMWVSSMTGGTEIARKINQNLARAAGEYGFGMGLGSCRQLLYSNEHLADFDVRSIMGDNSPLFANLGVAQVDQLLQSGEGDRMYDLLSKLRADGLILHVNPLQEAMQPEGDHFARAPVEIAQELVENYSFPLIVKEVGQGFGPASMRKLLQMPLAAIEFAAGGGTNFAKLELLRSSEANQYIFASIAKVGHTAPEMLEWVNAIAAESKDSLSTQHLIISGGVQDFLDGYYLIKKSPIPAVYGQASAFLRHARGEYADLQAFIESQLKGLALAQAFLTVK